MPFCKGPEGPGSTAGGRHRALAFPDHLAGPSNAQTQVSPVLGSDNMAGWVWVFPEPAGRGNPGEH